MSEYGIALGYYVDCDTALCADCIPDAGEWAGGNYVGWPGFEGWESPGAIFIDSESDYPTWCSECGSLIPHDLTTEGMAYVTELLGQYLGDPATVHVDNLAALMDEYGDARWGAKLPDEYVTPFIQDYSLCMLWANTDAVRDGELAEDVRVAPSDWQTPSDLWALEAFTPEAQAEIREDCEDFIRSNWQDLGGIDAGQAGHDFALTRNGNGTGFWDRGLGDVDDRLTKASHFYGTSTAWYDADDDSALVNLN